MMFDEMDIDVVDDLQGLKVEEEKLLDKEEREGEEIEIGAFSRASDPVRMYLREMGSVSLLTREGEVEIAKRIENGQREILSTVLNCPMAVKEVVNLGNAIRMDKVSVREVTDEIDEEASIEEEEAQKKRVLDFIDKVRRNGTESAGFSRTKDSPEARSRIR